MLSSVRTEIRKGIIPDKSTALTNGGVLTSDFGDLDGPSVWVLHQVCSHWVGWRTGLFFGHVLETPRLVCYW